MINFNKYVIAATALMLAVVAGCSYLAPRSRGNGPSMTAEGVRFRYHAPAATKVQLAANWPGNNWARGDGSAGEIDVGLMKADKNGMWEIVVPLGPGRYQYIFWVDEVAWRLDQGNPEEVNGGPAGVASQLLVFLNDGKLEIR